MKKFLMYLWQLPQNLLGLAVVKLSNAYKITASGEPWNVWYETHRQFGISLGDYRIIYMGCSIEDRKHEYGHTLQSRKLGWLYLIIIGIPSITFNKWDCLFHRKWSTYDRIRWYYSKPWEKWADELGNVGQRVPNQGGKGCRN